MLRTLFIVNGRANEQRTRTGLTIRERVETSIRERVESSIRERAESSLIKEGEESDLIIMETGLINSCKDKRIEL